MKTKPTLLWVGDAGCPSGFGLATHKILGTLKDAYDATVLGINYRGDPHQYPYDIFAAFAGGDAFGVGRIVWMCDHIRQKSGENPAVIVIQNDGWNIPLYVRQLKKFKEYADIPIVAAVAVDGKNFDGEWLKDVAHAVFWTTFALKEARAGGYTGTASVIPLGVDAEFYHPMDKYDARLRRGLPKELDDAFIVGNVNRNQPRKRWDLTIRYFAEWINGRNINDAWLYLHVAPTGDMGIDIKRLAGYYGVIDRLLLAEPPTFYGYDDGMMRDTYNSFNAQVSTTQGEGFGLTTFEGMACGIAQAVPGWSALGELCEGAAHVVPCTSTAIGPPYVNVIGGVVDEKLFIDGLHRLYSDEQYRLSIGEAGLARAREPRFRWEQVGREWASLLAALVQAQEAVA